MSASCQTTTVPPNSPPPPLTATPRPALSVVTTQAPRLLFPINETPATESIPAALDSSAVEPRPTQSGLVLPPTLLPPNQDSIMTAESEVIGYSAEGRAITAERFGVGQQTLVLVGGMHGGWEANTVELMNLLVTHFRENPADVLPELTLIIVPVANPDGMEHGRTARGRFNGNGVDLNRNWSCEWSREAYWRQERVNPGLREFSEPESQALANRLLAIRPAGVLFYHSAANGVFPGNCGGDHGSLALASAYAEAANYRCCAGFSAYPVSGTAATWADGERIPAADVELTQSSDPEFDRNLRGIIALQAWIARNDDS